jgi:hypothetical protein
MNLMTRFRAMIPDEQTKILEQSSQAALRAREEMIAAEAVESPLTAPVQDKCFPMT